MEKNKNEGFARLPDDDILDKFLPVNGPVLGEDLQKLADHINSNGFNLPIIKAIKNLVWKTHFKPTCLLIDHLNPGKIARKTDNVEYTGRRLIEIVYGARKKYIHRHKHDSEPDPRILKQRDLAQKLSVTMTIFCGKMYRADNKIRAEPQRRCIVL